MDRSARAFWVTRPGHGEIREQRLSPIAAGEVLVRTQFTALSRGTESIVYHGRVPASEHSRMRCPYQDGDFPAPVKYGYANVGRVLLGPSELRDRLVFSLYPHQTEFIVPAEAVIPLPENVPPERAVLAANLETALNAIWDARPLAADRISVVGGGVLGCLCAFLLEQLAGVDLELVDPALERRKVADALGIRHVTPESARSERDLILHASGAPAGLRAALTLAATEATIVELSWYADSMVELPLGQAFHARRLSLRSSQVGNLSPNARPRHTRRSRLALALELCAAPALDALIEPDIEFEALPEAAARVLAADSRVLCQRIRY
jgi:hypothetical protein